MSAARRKTPKKVDEAPHAYEGLSRVLHEKARLGILVALLGRPDGVLFPDLKHLCELTDGNLARHLGVLQETNVVEIWKGQESGPRSKTLVRLTDTGRTQFLAYLAELERVLDDARRSAKAKRTRREPGPGFAPS